MTMDLKTAAQEAITAFETFECADANERTECRRIAGLLRDALASSAASQGEPIGWANPAQLAKLSPDHMATVALVGSKCANFTQPIYAAPSASERQQGGEAICQACSGWVDVPCEDCPAPAATRAGEAAELVKRLEFLRIVTDEFKLKQIKVLAEAVFAAQPPQAPPAAPSAEQGEALFTPEHVAYVTQYGGHCRDCADENGVCPSSGLPCGGSEKAIRFVFNALSYGVKHKYISSPFVTQPAAPVGWVLVPVEPTEEMRQAGARRKYGWENGGSVISSAYAYFDQTIKRDEQGEHCADGMWRAMLAAAPKTGGANG
jgi:hypothetical protein